MSVLKMRYKHSWQPFPISELRTQYISSMSAVYRSMSERDIERDMVSLVVRDYLATFAFAYDDGTIIITTCEGQGTTTGDT